jgi:hypothetical protein
MTNKNLVALVLYSALEKEKNTADLVPTTKQPQTKGKIHFFQYTKRNSWFRPRNPPCSTVV